MQADFVYETVIHVNIKSENKTEFLNIYKFNIINTRGVHAPNPYQNQNHSHSNIKDDITIFIR